MKIVLIGQQGAGKGTIATLLKKKLDLPHISTGDIFRKAIKEGTELGKLVASLINDGKMVPDDVTVKIVAKRLSEPDCANGFLLDGFPRNTNQAEKLAETIGVDKVVLLDITDDLTVYRLAGRRVCKDCGATYNINPDGFPKPNKDGICDECSGELYQRDDDKEDAIRERLKIYHEQTEPVLDFYERKDKLVKIDASRPVDEILKDVLSVLN